MLWCVPGLQPLAPEAEEDGSNFPNIVASCYVIGCWVIGTSSDLPIVSASNGYSDCRSTSCKYAQCRNEGAHVSDVCAISPLSEEEKAAAKSFGRLCCTCLVYARSLLGEEDGDCAAEQRRTPKHASEPGAHDSHCCAIKTLMIRANHGVLPVIKQQKAGSLELCKQQLTLSTELVWDS
eukprot:4997203-Amphidinium_carterae.1